MKFTQYFLTMRHRSDRAPILLEWIESTVKASEREAVQRDGRIRRWAKIAEAGDRWLRIVLLEDGETVRNAFFDRGAER